MSSGGEWVAPAHERPLGPNMHRSVLTIFYEQGMLIFDAVYVTCAPVVDRPHYLYFFIN
jgi:hypothetical protein